jgi:hypothetical protein
VVSELRTLAAALGDRATYGAQSFAQHGIVIGSRFHRKFDPIPLGEIRLIPIEADAFMLLVRDIGLHRK